MSKWDSTQYLKFSEERKQPCVDLMNRLNDHYKSILDLGCGPGNSTKNLQNKYPQAEIVGIDIDDNMLEKAKVDYPDLKFIKGHIPESLDNLENQYDLIFSNACIHWIEKQEELIEKVYDRINNDGIFAIQIPLTQESAFYKALYTLIKDKWNKLSGIDNFHNLSIDEYYNKLSKKFSDVTIWTADYYHILNSKADIIEWYKGSGLRPYLYALNETEKELFLNDLNNVIKEQYHTLEDGKVFLIIPRLFIIAKK